MLQIPTKKPLFDSIKSRFGLGRQQSDKVLRLTFLHKDDVIDSVRQGHSDQGWNFKKKLVIGSGPFVRWRIVDRDYTPQHKLVFVKHGKLYLSLPQRKFVSITDGQRPIALASLKAPGNFPSHVLQLKDNVQGVIQLTNDWKIALDFISPPQVVVTPEQRKYLASVSVRKWWEPYDLRQYIGTLAVFSILFVGSYFYFMTMKDKYMFVKPYTPPGGFYDGPPQGVIPLPDPQPGASAPIADAGTTTKPGTERAIGVPRGGKGSGTGTGTGGGSGSGSGTRGLQKPGTYASGGIATLPGRTGTGSGSIGGGGGSYSSSGGGGYAMVGQTYKPFNPNEVVSYGSDASSEAISGGGGGDGEIGQVTIGGQGTGTITRRTNNPSDQSKPVLAGSGDSTIRSTIIKPQVEKPEVPDPVKISGLSGGSDSDNIASQIRRRQASFDRLFQDYTARVKRIRGEVTVNLTIDKNGRASAIVKTSSASIPRPFLDQIKQLVESWTYNVTAERPYSFKLQFS